MTIRSVWHVNNSQTREDTRFAPVGAMTPGNTSALTTYNGVIPSTGDPMGLVSTGPMTAQVNVGRAVVQGLSTQGCYPVVITSPEALTFADGDASLPRIDSVMLVIRDDPYDSTGFTDVRCIVVQGSPNASPTAPALPTSASLRLHNVLISAGTSAGGGGITWGSAITDTRIYSVAVGGIGVGAPTGAYAGQWRDSGGATGSLSRYTGSAWESALRLDTTGQLIIGDVNVRRDASNILATDDIFRIYRSASTDNALSVRLPADTASRFFMNADGNMNWGPGGSSSTDVNLYRPEADVLKTDSKFRSEVESVTSGLVAGTGWATNSFFGRRTAQVAVLDIYMNRTGADITNSPGANLADFVLCTAPTGWRPQHSTVSGFFDNGVAGFGGAVIGTDGIVSVRSSVGNILNNSNVRVQFTFLQVN